MKTNCYIIIPLLILLVIVFIIVTPSDYPSEINIPKQSEVSTQAVSTSSIRNTL
jgi:hypothetical protein